MYITSIECVIFSCFWLNPMFYLLWPQSIQDVDSKLSSNAWPRNEIKSDQGLWRGGEFADGCSLLSFTIAIPSEQEQMHDISCWNMCLIEGNGLENSRKVSIRSGEPCNDLTWHKCVLNTMMTTVKAGFVCNVEREEWTWPGYRSYWELWVI